MKQSKIIGLTGSIATGKSQAAKIIRSLGYPVIDADLIAREIVNDLDVSDNIKKYFGEDIYIDKVLNREKLGRIIFEDKNKRDKLNEITHPAIYRRINSEIESLKDDVIFLDIPLLIETIDNLIRYNLKIDEIWLVYVSEDIQINRLMKRDGIEYEYAKEKILSQIPVAEKKKYAKVLLDNSKSVEDLELNIKREIQKLKKDKEY